MRLLRLGERGLLSTRASAAFFSASSSFLNSPPAPCAFARFAFTSFSSFSHAASSAFAAAFAASAASRAAFSVDTASSISASLARRQKSWCACMKRVCSSTSAVLLAYLEEEGGAG